MAFIGLSILIASLSFVLYRHPPSSWTFLLPWLSRTGLLATPNESKRAVSPPELKFTESQDVPVEEAKSSLDRKAMPPPPPPFTSRPTNTINRTIEQPPSPPDTPRAQLTSSSAPRPLPSFPALNSAQRASGGRGPPKLNSIPTVQPPLRSPFLMSPPMRSPLPNRSPTASTSLAPPPTHSSIPTKPSKKVLLTPGHSPLDWAHLSSRTDVNLRGLPLSTPYLRVPPSLLRNHTGRKGKDAWTVLGGKVYNITPYIPYHPGGEPELMKAAGRDGTKLFGEIHPWVNWEGMLENCLVGIAVGEEEIHAKSLLEDMD